MILCQHRVRWNPGLAEKAKGQEGLRRLGGYDGRLPGLLPL
jgi:hypothetical protein